MNSVKETAEFNAAQAIYKTSPNYRLDQSGTIKAIDAFSSLSSTLILNHPKWLKQQQSWSMSLRAKLEKKAYEQRWQALLDIKIIAAISTFENLLTDFPDTKNDREWDIIAKSMFLAENSIFEKQKNDMWSQSKVWIFSQSISYQVPTPKRGDCH